MIDNLSPELIFLIYEFLPSTSDVRNMRLVSRVLGEIGFKPLFKVLHINPTFASLRDFGLRKVSQVQRFASIVEEVVIHIKHPRDIIDGICRQNTVAQYNGVPKDYRRIRGVVREEVERQWFRSIHERSCATALTECFSSLPRLSAIRIYQEPVRLRYSDQGDYRPKAEATYKLCAIMIAASSIKSQLVTFETNMAINVYHQRWLPYPYGVLRDCISDVLENIQTLHVRLIRGERFKTDILNMAKNLVQLKIGFTHIINHRPRDGYFNTDSLISSMNIWPRLEQLILEDVALGNHGTLLDLLRRHRSTLRVFTLKDCEYNCKFLPQLIISKSSKTWENLITEMESILSNCQINIINPWYYGCLGRNSEGQRNNPCTSWCMCPSKTQQLPSVYTRSAT